MTKMGGVDPFPKLWARRSRLELPGGIHCQVMALPDLVQAKKTQRDKDWPMLRRLIEAHYFQNREAATAAQTAFWLRELRTPELLVEVPPLAGRLGQTASTPVAPGSLARLGREAELAAALVQEEGAERQADARYWKPLKAELERLRHRRPRGPR